MKSKLMFILAMVIFGTIGIFVRFINLESSEIAMLRGLIGSLFLLLISLIRREKMALSSVRENLLPLVFSGAVLAGNWIFLFEAIKHTTIANATLSYYMAPVFVIGLSPLVLKEKIIPRKVVCLGAALVGMLLILKGSSQSGAAGNDLLGIAWGIAAAACYASLMLTNKFIKKMNGMATTLLQLAIATVVLFCYVSLNGGIAFSGLTAVSVTAVLALGLVHTGLGFFLFFTGMKGLNGQSIATLSYIDPITALLASFLVFGEAMNGVQMLGAALLLGATFLGEHKTAKPPELVGDEQM
ncbi:MAG: transporter [Acetobacterium sp. MES1]|uniref:DMT family transporter n=1 Tax=Acetobacterium sp. MES1 TaxID=1899015 RepID=UPI000B9CD400|nr:EamA family transporter [Acetobacterium sp. MES1]OXS24968.1 MAG: transporter [Acetobacterium sp. MES1]